MIIELSKGQQITIPSNIRKKLRLKVGSKLEITEKKGEILIRAAGKDLEELFKEAKRFRPKKNLDIEKMEEMIEREVYRQ